MKKIITLVMVFMVAVSLLSVFVPGSFGQDYGLTEDLQINNYRYYTSPNSGALVVIGEVQNVGTQYFHSARVRASVLNESGEFLSESVYSYIYADQIAPGEKAAFYMIFAGEQSATGDLSWVDANIDNIEFYFFGSADNNQQDSGLNVAGHDGAVTGNGNYTVTGMILNRGQSYPEKYFVVGTFYDSSGEVIAVGISNYLQRYLGPNNVTAFNLGLYDAPAGIGNQISSYSLRVIAESTVDEVPTATPSTTAPITSPGTSPNPTSTSSAAPSNNDNTESSNTLYIALAAVGIAIAVVVLVLLLRRR